MADDSRSLTGLAPHAYQRTGNRLLMPSVTDIIFIALMGVLLFTSLSTKLLNDAGIGWHVRTGQIILRTHHIPRTDPFAAIMRGKPWFAWEWLYDAIVGELDRIAGLNGVVWFNAVLIAAVFAGTFKLLLRQGTKLWVALPLVLLAASASMVHFLARPHVVSWFMCLLWLWVLESDSESRQGRASRAIWILPFVMVLWVNLHGGFLIAFVLLGIYLMDALWLWSASGEPDRFWRLLWATLVCAAATLVNPYGPKLLTHIRAYLSDRFLMDHIQEFQSPNFHGIAQKCFAWLILIAFLAVAVRVRQLRTIDFLLVIFAIYSGLYATRNIPASSILLIFVAGPLLSEARIQRHPRLLGVPRREGFFSRMSAVESGARGHLWILAAVIASLVIVLHQGKIRNDQLVDAHFDPHRFPAAAVDYAQMHELPGPILGPDFWGGYFIYRLYPTRKVVLDDRHDFYGAEELKSYLKFLHAEPGWQEFLDQSHAGCLILPKASPMATVAAIAPGWRTIYSDDVAVVLVQSAPRS